LIREVVRFPFRRRANVLQAPSDREEEMTELNMKFLVVDDFATMRRIVKNILRQIGYTNILEAENGQMALDVLRREKVDFIISDWNMPQMPGIELLKAVRSQEEWKDLPFLMVTAEGQKENVLEAVKFKVSNYIVKPFTPETFIEKMNKILEKK
jgi:two-component system, chemotaxis family, chemotaxis protein CheY